MSIDARIPPRMYSLKEVFVMLRKERNWPAGAVLSTAVLDNLEHRYFIDLDGAKVLHGIEHADRHKRAAFTIKWIAQLRPIQVCAGTKASKEVLLINELFAMYAGLEHLDISFADIDRAWMKSFLFTLRYHHEFGKDKTACC